MVERKFEEDWGEMKLNEMGRWRLRENFWLQMKHPKDCFNRYIQA